MKLEELDIPKPASDVTVDGFINEWMPMATDKLKDVIKENAGGASGTLLTTKVTGDGGGVWSLGIADGALEVMEGARDDAAITLKASVANFLEIVRGQRDDILLAQINKDGGGGQGGLPDLGKVVKMIVGMADKARKIEGSVRLKFDDPQQPLDLTAKFAGPETDQATVAVIIKLDDLRKLASGELSAKKAMITRKIKIKGNMGFLLKLATLAQKPKK